MARKGWGGTPPGDDAEARRMILEAAVRCVERAGAAGTSLSDVAAELGVMRPTVYRYFASTEDLFAAVGEVAFEDWLIRMEDATRHLDDPAELLVEKVAFIVEQLPTQPLLVLLLTSGQADDFGRRMLEPTTIARCHAILLDQRVDWAAAGFDEAGLDDLIEYLLRLVHSLLLVPTDPPRSASDLRAFLDRWVTPAVREKAHGSKR